MCQIFEEWHYYSLTLDWLFCLILVITFHVIIFAFLCFIFPFQLCFIFQFNKQNVSNHLVIFITQGRLLLQSVSLPFWVIFMNWMMISAYLGELYLLHTTVLTILRFQLLHIWPAFQKIEKVQILLKKSNILILLRSNQSIRLIIWLRTKVHFKY